MRAFPVFAAIALAGSLSAAPAWAASPGAGDHGLEVGLAPIREVGLIFANIGAGLSVGGEPVLAPATYSAVVLVVIVTTLVTPPALRWSVSRKARAALAEDAAAERT